MIGGVTVPIVADRHIVEGFLQVSKSHDDLKANVANNLGEIYRKLVEVKSDMARNRDLVISLENFYKKYFSKYNSSSIRLQNGLDEVETRSVVSIALFIFQSSVLMVCWILKMCWH